MRHYIFTCDTCGSGANEDLEGNACSECEVGIIVLTDWYCDEGGEA